ncbi:hypothetical protein PUNSTDRAFT_132875 [Punctularia strigosozonata HHB-11173 SS5]|uniref:uncharacterized protein n=1 Tax=Punctularia strigosozonata (strain HHB-11173) TaxID=741275 RepID=UPI0004417548|nr:uncharacterized protein PUNSTDRAFT_132875 [Punctularia strigosozonata HHB-11173 SS5]EIN10805.1 hypothetical protein PUNSTDRAFT_132875 [Punctularia strigosozonata HHB-11173 SS5]
MEEQLYRGRSDSSITSTSTRDSIDTSERDDDDNDKALESHEVIELQTFSERKAWIVEKIKLLESMPPVNAFVGLEAVRKSSTEMPPGLPTREELESWLIEHDKIEKETEIFDSGELKKLRKFTKAAAKRNMSPEDTDLIELTLTTILELDRLLHLLRDRSENLDLLGIRIAWEEKRTAGWVDLANITSDIRTYLNSHARWSPSVYENIGTAAFSPPAAHQPLRRRGSVVSLASLNSINSVASLSQPGFSRAARFKHAEHLSREAVQLAGKVTALRHGKITAAGKLLDKMIDISRRPVPDELLDEQDTLEEKGINEMENVGKFMMSVVTQWKKADEIYTENLKDQSTAQALLDEIEAAHFTPPNAKQSANFLSRVATLLKRAATRADASLLSVTFPAPSHPLFPEQHAVKADIVAVLLDESRSTAELAKKAESSARAYYEGVEAVQKVENLLTAAADLINRFTTFRDQLLRGITIAEGDGSRPDFSSVNCLQPDRHAAFVKLLPSLCEEIDKANAAAQAVLRDSQSALLRTERPGIDPQFTTLAMAQFQQLSTLTSDVATVRIEVSQGVNKLQAARRAFTMMCESLAEMDAICCTVKDAMAKQRWRRQSQSHSNVPTTPESPGPIGLVTALSSTPADEFARLHATTEKQDKEILPFVNSLADILNDPLKQYFSDCAHNLTEHACALARLVKTWEALLAQASIMDSFRNNAHTLQLQGEDAKLRYDNAIKNLLQSELASSSEESDENLLATLNLFERAVEEFTAGLASKVIFIAQGESTLEMSIKTPVLSPSGNTGPDALRQSPVLQLPFDLTALDADVRADSNSYAMALAGDVQILHRKHDHLQLARISKELDIAVASILTDIQSVENKLGKVKSSLTNTSGDFLQRIAVLKSGLEELLHSDRARIARSFSPPRELLRRMDKSPACADSDIHQGLITTRIRALDDFELRFNTWVEEATHVKHRLSQIESAELQRLEEDRVAEEQRLAAEERARLEHELQETQAKERRERREQERLELEEKERHRREEQRRMEEEALEIQAKEEQDRREKEERDRLEKEERERAEREQEAHERCKQEERERHEQEARQRREQEELERRKQEVREKRELEGQERRERERREREERELRDQEEAERKERAEHEAREERERKEMEDCELREKEDREQREREELELRERERDQKGVAEASKKEREDHNPMRKGALERREREVRDAEEQSWGPEQERLPHARTNHEGQDRLECHAEDQASLRRETLRTPQEDEHAEEPSETQQEDAFPVSNEPPCTDEAPMTQAEQKANLLDHTIQEEDGDEADTASAAWPDSTDMRTPTGYPDEDVFGLRVVPIVRSLSVEMSELQKRVASLRKRLRSIAIYPDGPSSSVAPAAPSEERRSRMESSLYTIAQDAAQLPPSVDDPIIDTELRSLRMELAATESRMTRWHRLADFATKVQGCDAALSDLLEHIDSYPAPPAAPLSSSHISSISLPPEEQLSARLLFTKTVVETMESSFAEINDDRSAASEQDRILQTWTELEDMARDRLKGRKSRPPSALSSGRESRSSTISNRSRVSRISNASDSSATQKKKGYTQLSVRPTKKGGMLAPAIPSSRRNSSNSSHTPSRSISKMSTASSSRSVSGPNVATPVRDNGASTSSRSYSTTFASRQRTSSTASTTSSSIVTPVIRTPGAGLRPRAQTGQILRAYSPSPSDVSSLSRSTRSASRSTSVSHGTWSRAARLSLSGAPGTATPPSKIPKRVKKEYVPNPKNRLDVAVSHVVNKLPVDISISIAEESWKDQSGKYWIGEQENPRLCFCRILRSQMVMVRVGGGWVELSKFIKDHFADLFRVLPVESPPRAREERWINAATLQQQPTRDGTPPAPPRTPEPKHRVSNLPTFALSTPSGQIHETSRPIRSRFIRTAALDADEDP